jgi:hypothetical protein
MAADFQMKIAADIITGMRIEKVSPDRAIGMNLAPIVKTEEDKEAVIGTTDAGTATAIETATALVVGKRQATIVTTILIGTIKVVLRLMIEIGLVDITAIIEALLHILSFELCVH